jgi:hypothetical protein
MNDMPAQASLLSAQPATPFLLRRHKGVPTLAVLLIGLFVTAGALSKSALIGRLAFPMTHNDVAYLIDGIRRLVYIEVNGFWAGLWELYVYPSHAPLSAYQAALGFYLFGFHDWAPYLTDIVYVWTLLAATAVLLRRYPDAVVIAALLAVASIPLTASSVTEFAPEIPLGLFTALGVLALLPIPMTERAPRRRFVAGLAFGLGFLAKPSSFAFTPVVVCAALSVVFVRDIVIARQFRRFPAAVVNGALQLAFVLWLPALYLGPNFNAFASYFYEALFDKANVTAFGYFPDVYSNVFYCLTGGGGAYVFGDLLWLYLIVIALGILSAIIRNDGTYIKNSLQYLIVIFVMWLLPTVSAGKNVLFGAPFSFLLILMIAMAIGSIFDLLRGSWGALATLSLGGLLMLSGTTRYTLPNTPGFEWTNPGGAHVIQRIWPKVQDRFFADLTRNSPNYYGGSVYLSEGSGYYHNATLIYWFLKKDVTLDWSFDTLWADPDPKDHLAYIQTQKPEFVIAGERGNGLTLVLPMIPGASAAENAVLSAMWADPNYIPIDEFYGPNGRTIAVFQRQTSFAGWQMLVGLGKHGRPDAPNWMSEKSVAHISSYAPDAVAGTLTLQVEGTPGESMGISFNGASLETISIDADGNAAFTHPLDLKKGDNDLVFTFTGENPLVFTHLVVSRKIKRFD